MISQTTGEVSRLAPLHEVRFQMVERALHDERANGSPRDRVGRIRRELIGECFDTAAEIVIATTMAGWWDS